MTTTSLEDRLLVAIAGRGQQRIGQLIVDSLRFAGIELHYLYGWPDEALVKAVEEYVFYEDAAGLPARDAQGTVGVAPSPHLDGDVRS